MSLRLLMPALATVALLSVNHGARAANTITVLQFGGTNQSSTAQFGSTTNSSFTLQFGSANQASALQVGAIALTTNNTSVIGQGGDATAVNTAQTGQIGGSNTSLTGQIGGSNSSAVSQLGILNGSTILQASP